ncbi:MAG: CRTAC1 family protein [Chloroflexota bacterium]
MHYVTICIFLIVPVLTGCVPIQPPASTIVDSIQTTQTALLPASSPCQDVFVSHDLDHTTFTEEQANPLFESNGSGLAIDDLDNDGLLDIVLANLDGPNTILWNQGDLQFRRELLDDGNSGHARAVNIIDYDGDGWMDIAFTHRRMAAPTLWRSQGGEGRSSSDTNSDGNITFVKSEPFVYGAYTMAWADLDGDTDLDLVTGAYDIEQEKMEDVRNLREGNGVVYYENRDGDFEPTQLTPIAQALALLLIDLNDDQRLDIWVGNDFFHPDFLWLRTDTGWENTKLFALTTQNTMSFDAGDLDNDGEIELFAADMKPYVDESMEAWQPLMANMMHDPFHNDPQIMANVLQIRDEAGEFQESAGPAGVDGTGWTWSAKFGDLDNDGLLDLYAVNGMVDPTVFSHMPNFELVEENQAFRNQGEQSEGTTFLPAPEWQLNATTGGRGMSMADLDNDGDLDIVVNNYGTPAQLFENRLCTGNSLAVALSWPGSKNIKAIGSMMTLHTDTGIYQRDIRTASGYLSGDPSRVHFGLPKDSTLLRLEIHWPDGLQTTIEEPERDMLLSVLRKAE